MSDYVIPEATVSQDSSTDVVIHYGAENPDTAKVMTEDQYQQRLAGRPVSKFAVASSRVLPGLASPLQPVLPQFPATAPPVAAVSVTFEFERLGQLEVAYTDVVVSPSFIVLVLDKRATAGPRYFPPEPEDVAEPPKIAMRIADQSVVYFVHTTGLQYVVGTLEHCVLLIDHTGYLSEQSL